MTGLIAPTVNLLILIGILVYYLREPLKQFVRQRHQGFREELTRVRRLLHEAQEKHEEFSSKLRAISAETTALREQIVQDAKTAKHRLASDAQRLAQGIVSDARTAADTLYSEVRGQLSSEMGARILDRVEKLLRDRLTGDDRARIRQEFSSQVERVQ